MMPVPTSPVRVLGAHAAGGNGPDWTSSWSDVVSWLMVMAEAWFGPRDARWFFTGLELWEGDVPSTYYPGNRPFHVGIQLTQSAASNPKQAYFQLAHEVVHLLGPSPTRECANVLEEGMATRFQLHISHLVGLGFPITLPSYVHAMGELDKLLALSPDAVRTIRAVHPDLRHVTDTELMKMVRGVSPELAASLCGRFVR